MRNAIRQQVIISNLQGNFVGQRILDYDLSCSGDPIGSGDGDLGCSGGGAAGKGGVQQTASRVTFGGADGPTGRHQSQVAAIRHIYILVIYHLDLQFSRIAAWAYRCGRE